MDCANYDARLPAVVASTAALAGEPFVLVDVGCSSGIDPLWRLFGDRLRAYAIDPQLREIERLREQETHPGVSYHACLIGLPDDHPVVRGRGGRPADADLLEVLAGTSAFAAASSAPGGPDWRSEPLATERIGLAEFLRREHVDTVDFVKIDTDGHDLDALLSLEETIQPAQLLGVMIESPFVGSDDESANTFHNIDRALKRHRFSLAALEVNRYSRTVLPAPFRYELFAQTQWGQPVWADLVYLREADRLGPAKLLKLAALCEIFEVPDRAVELLLERRHALERDVDVDAILDLLTPPLDGEIVGYGEYLAAFEEDPGRFYPRPAPEPATSVSRRRRLLASMLRRPSAMPSAATRKT